MARVVLLFLVFTFLLLGLAHGRPKEKSAKPKGENGEKDFVAMKRKLDDALDNTETQPRSSAVTTNPEETAAGDSNFMEEGFRDEQKRGMPTAFTRRAAVASGRPATPTRPRATEEPPADISNDNEYIDEFLSIPAMRKRRSLDSNDAQEAEETDPLEQELVKRVTRPAEDKREFHIATIIPTVFPVEDVQAVPRAIISASNVLEDGQFDESITIYSDPRDQAIEQEQKKGLPEADQKSMPSNEETSRQQAESSTRQQREETKLEVTRSKIDPQLDENLNANDVMVNKKEMFLADEMPEGPPAPADEKDKKDVKNDNQLAMNENKRNLPRKVMSNELDELKREDWEAKKAAPEGGQIKYEVDDDPAERSAKRKANMKLKMKLGKLRKKNIFA